METQTQELSEIDTEFVKVKFQKGPVKKVSINGCQTEDLIKICIERLKGFQKGPFACQENMAAVIHLMSSLEWLEFRTAKRVQQNVEGTNVVHV